MTSNDMVFNYFIGDESEQFSFIRVPKLFFTDRKFKSLSYGGKILYGILLDRMGLSKRNKWIDENRRVYVVYTIESIQEDFSISKTVAVKFMRELEEFGLIEKKRRPNAAALIYVKNFIFPDKEDRKGKAEIQGSLKTGLSEVQNVEVQKLDFLENVQIQGSLEYGLPQNRLPEVQNMESNKTNNKTNNYISSSSNKNSKDEILKKQSGYYMALKYYPSELVETVFRVLKQHKNSCNKEMEDSETMLIDVCRNITDHSGTIYNLTNYIQKCLDNMQASRKLKMKIEKRDSALGNIIMQNQYDFEKLEKELLEASTRVCKDAHRR